MSAPPPPPHLITLRDVAERRVWCPGSGCRVQAPGDAFAPNCCCIGPRCAAWTWRSANDALEVERQRHHLVPPHFSPSHRVRLASQTLGDLVEPLRVLAQGEGELDAARATILAWARANWRPEQAQPAPEAWQRPGIPFWDQDADTVAVDLVRPLGADQRAGTCGLARSTVNNTCTTPEAP